MSFVKRNYIDYETVVTAENLNDIQDAIIQIVPDDVKQALLQIASKVAYIDEHGQDYYDALESALYPDAALVSISAVYTQSGTVYDTDSLDSLKDDLVVTATYSDSSTEVVTAYTLSGTLTAGTSTITVAYGGKTTTFDVTVTYRYIINSSSPNVSFGSFDIAQASNGYKSNTNANRVSCLGENLLGYECEYGYKYVITVTGATYSTMQISASVWNETAKTAIQNTQDSVNDNRYTPSWLDTSSPIEITPPQTINGSAPALMWLAIRRNTSNNNFNNLSEIGTITITREAVS